MKKIVLLFALGGLIGAFPGCSEDDETTGSGGTGGGTGGKAGSSTGGKSGSGTGGSSGSTGGSGGSTGGSGGSTGGTGGSTDGGEDSSAGAAGAAGAPQCPSFEGGACCSCGPIWLGLTNRTGGDPCCLPDFACGILEDGGTTPGTSIELFIPVFECACDTNGCAAECDAFCNAAEFPSTACSDCLPTKCTTAWNTCIADDGSNG